MARISGVEPTAASPFARLTYFLVRRRLGRVITPIKVKAHHPRLLRGYVHMELAQDAANTLPAPFKSLVLVKVAKMVGCPF